MDSVGAMGGIAGVIILVLHPQAAALQAQAFGLKDEQAKKAAFEAFFRLHKPIRSLYVVNVLLGIWLLVLKTNRSLQQEGIRREKGVVGLGGRNRLRRARSWI